MKYRIVVARYNEDIDWTRQFSNVVIYNKGISLHDNTINELCLPNVGREGHTYYKYICDNYDNLDEYTIFLQGYPFDHSPNLISNLQRFIQTDALDIDFEFLSEHLLYSNLSGCRYHGGLPLQEVYKTVFNESVDDKSFIFGAGAQFIVSKHAILKRPKSFYANIVKLLEYDINPIEGFVIERFHSLVFVYT